MKILCNRPSKGAKALSEALGCKRIKELVKADIGDLIINWGVGKVSFDYSDHLINLPDRVRLAVDKAKCFESLKACSVPTVKFTTIREEALEFIEEGSKVYCRTLVASSAGKGIVIANCPDELVEAKLYTKQAKTLHEVRIHVFLNNSEQGCDYYCQLKKKLLPETLISRGIVNTIPGIRNTKNGWVFTSRIDSVKSEYLSEAKDVAYKAILALGLHFGAADIIIDEEGHSKVLEINTAPGLETSLPFYVNNISILNQ